MIEDKSPSGRLRLVYTWNLIFFFLWAYRCVFSLLGEVVIMRITGIPDTQTYQSQDAVTALAFLATSTKSMGLQFTMQAFATAVTNAVGGIFNLLFLGNPILINIGFQTIGFAGIVVLLRSVTGQLRIVLMLLLMLPSISLWTSIASKEALLLFFLGIICAHIVNIYYNCDRIRWYLPVCLLLLYTFKPHYMIPIVFILGVSYVARHVRQKAFVAFFALMISFVMLYVFAEQIDEYARTVNSWTTALGGRSTRPLFIILPYDTFLKAPEGMYLAFFGPTLKELSTTILHLATFIESSLIIALLGFYLFRRWPELPLYNVIVALGTSFWTLFPNYPLGVFNPGTAIRYRSGYIILILLSFVFILSRERYAAWRGPVRKPPVADPRPEPAAITPAGE